MRFDDPTLALLRSQFGAINRRQLRKLGYAGPQIDAMVRRGQLERVGHGVYVRTGTPRSTSQDAVAAVLRVGGPARVSGLLLFALIGCEGYEPEEASFTVLVPSGRQLSEVPFSWRCDPAPGRDGATVVGVPAVAPARNVLELAVDLAEDEALLLAVDRLRWRTRTGADELARLAEALPDHPGVARLDRLDLLDPSRPESPGERDLAPLLEELGVPYEWQVWVAPDLRVDVLLRDCSIVIERDGPTHDGDRDRERDAERDRRLEALGYLVVHVTAADRHHPEELCRRLLALREARLADRATVPWAHPHRRSQSHDRLRGAREVVRAVGPGSRGARSEGVSHMTDFSGQR